MWSGETFMILCRCDERNTSSPRTYGCQWSCSVELNDNATNESNIMNVTVYWALCVHSFSQVHQNSLSQLRFVSAFLIVRKNKHKKN